MEENKQTAEILNRIEKNSRRQARFAALQCILTLVAAAFCAAGFYLIWQLLPLVTQALPQISSILDQMQTVLSNLETTTEQLARIDLSGMVTGVDTLADGTVISVTPAISAVNGNLNVTGTAMTYPA